MKTYTLDEIKEVAIKIMNEKQLLHTADDPNHYLSKGIQMLIVELDKQK